MFLTLDGARRLGHYGWGLLQLGELQAGLFALEQAAAAAEADAELVAALGVALAKVDRREEAAHAFERSVALDGANLHVRCAWGETLLDLRRYADALPVLMACVERDPAGVHPAATRARALVKRAAKRLGGK